MPMKTTQGAEPATLQAFCERHLPVRPSLSLCFSPLILSQREQQEIRAAALAAEAEQEKKHPKHSSKAARAYNKTYKPGPPIVPAIIVNRIAQYMVRVKIRKKTEFVQLVCRYWSLKREARRGAPLLKRLHLEPWTAGGGKIQTVEEKRMKLDVSYAAFQIGPPAHFIISNYNAFVKTLRISKFYLYWSSSAS